MRTTVRILDIQQITHDVKCFRIEKPKSYHFTPGQATDVSINKPGLEQELRPFTFTALNKEEYLEFTIKRYESHHGVTDQLHRLMIGDELIIDDAWGAIEYKGLGYFIAGGAGITPFISILRQLNEDGKIAGNTLLFSNKTAKDLIYEKELRSILGDQAVFTLTQDEKEGYETSRIDKSFIKQHVDDFEKHFYVCGPDQMVTDVLKILENSGAKAEGLVFEK